MSHITRKLLLAGLSLVLFGGTISPVLVQADSAETPSVTANSSRTEPIKISSEQMPYINYVNGKEVQQHYLFSGLHDSYTSDEILGKDNGAAWGTNFLASIAPSIGGADSAKMAESFIKNMVSDGGTFVGKSLEEPLSEFIFGSTSTSVLDASKAQLYYELWFIKEGAAYQLDKNSFNLEEAKEDYVQNVSPKIISDFGIDVFKDTFDSRANFEKFVIPTAESFCQILYINYNDPDFVKEFSQLNPEATANNSYKLWTTTYLKDYLTPQLDANGNVLSYSADGLLVASQVIANGPGDLIFGNESPSTPAPSSPAPTSQPVTVHYVDDQGNALKPDKSLTGSLGGTYKAEPLTITGYTLAKTAGTESGTFGDTAQTVTYTYTKNAVKATVLSATKKIGLYSSPDFSSKTLKQWYAKKSRLNRPMFEVIGTATSKTGVKRYQVKDVNSESDTFGQTGYITANTDYMTSAYDTPTDKQITVIGPEGVNAYSQKDLTHQKAHYQQGQVLTIKKVVTQNMTTRFLLTNGTYITANKQLVTTGKQTMPKRVQAKTALNRYGTANLTKRNHHYTKKAHATFKVTGWAYSNANDFSKGDTLRYKVAGGYITANKHLVRAID
ncbi:DUF5776 domain-containing protein [Levilactobacillus fuyuanensis]|uniref:DUF5776 domain-containing protein n=1 Tax=Levilactobacillus fuyuanensis TaxID=2486022 RepID=A0ABW4H1L7_9LACO|nr:DUF5776 domain-containing protein [Levilactobacillus fuyuanensis]